jgi:hypothetical protein
VTKSASLRPVGHVEIREYSNILVKKYKKKGHIEHVNVVENVNIKMDLKLDVSV